VITLRDLDLRAAEEELVSCCIDQELALAIALESLPLQPFKSELADELHRTFYVLTGWLSRSEYDGNRNRDRLEAVNKVLMRRGEEPLLLPDWCPWGVIPDYVEALCDALNTYYEFEDGAFTAWQSFLDKAPLAVSQTMLDALFVGLGPALARLKNAGVKPHQTTESPPPAVSQKRGILDAFAR
jgi:hypothetical protein